MVVRSSSPDANQAVDPRSIGDESWYDIADRVFATTIRYGESAEWSGPASSWLVWHEAELQDGEWRPAGWRPAPTDARRTRDGKPVDTASFEPLGAVLPREASKRLCAFCGHLDRFSANGYCLGCHRHGQDERIGHARRRPAEPEVQKPRAAEDDGLDGGTARRLHAQKNARPPR